VLTETQKEQLLSIARQSLERHLGGLRPDAPRVDADLPDASGVFVTIRRRGELRGCLGTLQLRGSLDEEVARCARDSATEDPRFPAMSHDELPETSLEISVLGPLERIDPAADGAIVVGRHGLVAEQGSRRGLLLPQVAVEWGWTPEQFLRQTCHKAGLPLDAWQHGAAIFRFDAEVFGE
jgi:AmmeMemoRadiSam system protein A